MTPPARLQAALLLPAPVLSVVYLLAVRAATVPPHFAPLVALGALPAVAAVSNALALWRTSPPRHGGWRAGMLAVAVAELAWILVALAMIGFAIAWRSG